VRRSRSPTATGSGQAYRRAELVFKLLEEVEASDGAIVLRATDEAVNLFVGRRLRRQDCPGSARPARRPGIPGFSAGGSPKDRSRPH
jgi:hypothetical protein